ncbi:MULTISPECIES: hypothetical protein [Cyanophyceae]|uniref:Uncharacterized protein n=1 Tax=Leptolyngbya subtilissima DQ-A4 TaxID=2933933 RepID=A0ABV0JYB0_9CYAN|nr:hypothetical protein [Nodosilinea sp. FACHB-141]
MESIKVRQHIEQDGILHLALPVGLADRDVDVMVIYQPVQASASVEISLAAFYGICADDPIVTEERNPTESSTS